MKNTIKGSDPAPGTITIRQGQHVALMEMDARIQPLRFGNHARREIDTQSGYALAMQIAGDLSGSAAQIADGAEVACFPGQAVQAGAVKRFVIHFVFESFGIIQSNPVITVLGVCNKIAHLASQITRATCLWSPL